jgi:hypothetical protein
VLLLVAGTLAAAQRPDPLARLVAKLRHQQAVVPSWTAQLKVDIDVPGMHVKGKRVDLRFTAPDSFAFETRGFALLPRRAFMWTADSLFAGLSNPRILAGQPGDPRGSIHVRGVFREEGLLARMDYRVDTLRWVVTRVSAWHDTVEVVRLDNDWFQAARGVWLPSAVRMRMSFSAESQRFYERMRGTLRRRESAREGTGTITMTFEKHKLGGRRTP